MKEKQDKKQMHEYNLEEYGLTVDQINTTFADYIKEYNDMVKEIEEEK